MLLYWLDELARRYGSNTQVAHRLGVTPSTVSRWRRGTSEVTLANLVKIADLTGQSLGDLLMTVYAVPPERLLPTTLVERADAVAAVAGPVPVGHYRLVFLFREDDTPAPWTPTRDTGAEN